MIYQREYFQNETSIYRLQTNGKK